MTWAFILSWSAMISVLTLAVVGLISPWWFAAFLLLTTILSYKAAGSRREKKEAAE
jgi:hypothetical protein